MTQPQRNDQFYTSQFYDSFASMSHSSAMKVLSVVFDYIKPQTIADVGCGVGTWLAAAEQLGCRELTGFDGEWVNKDDLLSRNIDLREINFESEFEIGGQYDLCMALEVAEHVSEGQSERFVDQLCRAAEVVLFSAAIPWQGGSHHVNEQVQSYWIKKFRARNFDCFDVIRSRVWQDSDVEYWYRQNSFLFVRTDSTAVDRERLRWDCSQGIYDIVHPGFYAWKMGEYQEPSVRSLLKHARAFFKVKKNNFSAAVRSFGRKLPVTRPENGRASRLANPELEEQSSLATSIE